MKKRPYADDRSRLWLLLSQTRHAIVKLRQRELASLGLSSIEVGVMTIVDSLDYSEATPANIARFFLREPHAISQLLNRMENKGLVKKQKDLKPKNLVRIELTEKGHEAYKKGKNRKIIKKIMNRLSEKQRNELESYLRILLQTAMLELNLEDTIMERTLAMTPLSDLQEELER
ncbi:MAG: MarR family transcriptional regulator [Deltaproteobacteria bacterium]|nr:MarR family transcriptional regulator [Deltaproteobacteria bacterium]